MTKIYLVAHAPSSPYRLIDLAKLAYSFNFINGFVVVKPVGLAAQNGLPEVFKLAYKHGKSLFVLSQLRELKDLLSIEMLVFIIQGHKDAPDIENVINRNVSSLAIIVQAGETPFNKEDISLGYVSKISEMSEIFSPNAVAEAAAALLKISKILR
ncbi:RecB-family nuclease [Ignisphaera sp. 4213-co]|uniref:RecB-family nuclease n=1 Tax=Ignisphaera cupida TaxID=3050454 RepID=A0ABD4Z359_9CREN|nr:RecB-family nuclease [Ignisphaera sp. 4213-co]MDK6027771.1 RecB-family nuclease [Ignisphaera sp. 4213-co]